MFHTILLLIHLTEIEGNSGDEGGDGESATNGDLRETWTTQRNKLQNPQLRTIEHLQSKNLQCYVCSSQH